ncbi:MAG: ATP-binding protein [Candidatus Electryonea clarkiae]|nr:ATP-binding protein [Candidatus Electryonea clarkiae]MDP8285139.1 ATP-binding protein [Candidatus Electryonea clarkiae]
MTDGEFLELVHIGKETRALEFKRSTPWKDSVFKAKIVKTMLAISNIRDGGNIVIGVEQNDDDSFSFTGMTETDLDQWKYDDISSHVSEFADPFVKFSMDRIIYDEKTFIVLTIFEFIEIPVLCKRDGESNLRRGAIYTRTHRLPESAEIPSQTELREILELAIEKRLRSFVRTASHAGIPLSKEQSDAERFDEQLGDF